MTNNEKFMRARDETGALPLHLAAALESHHVLQYFADHYPSTLNVKDAMGRTALHIVSQKGNHSLYKMLKQAGADPKILDQKGRTADFYLQNAKSEHSPRKSISDSSKTTLKSNLDSIHSSSVSARASKNS
ncbi:Espin, partial [Stegodyphus mimosarum]